MKIDSHQHFWKYNPVRDAWIIEELGAIRRDFLPNDLKPILDVNEVDGCVAVQADQSIEETHFLLELADANPFIKGVVGWIDLNSNSLQDQLEGLNGINKLKGFRHILQAEHSGFMLNDSFIGGVSMLHDYGYSYDILIYESQLSEALQLVHRLPEMRLVIDHLAKPKIKGKTLSGWKAGLARLAEYDHVSLKLSGMITEANWQTWTYDDVHPYLEAALEVFGAERLLFGSDWPVCLVAGSYKEVWNVVDQFICPLSTSEQEKIMGLNAVQFYRL